MSSGRDVMMDKWDTDREERIKWLKGQEQRQRDYLDTINEERDRIIRNLEAIRYEIINLEPAL